MLIHPATVADLDLATNRDAARVRKRNAARQSGGWGYLAVVIVALEPVDSAGDDLTWKPEIEPERVGDSIEKRQMKAAGEEHDGHRVDQASRSGPLSRLWEKTRLNVLTDRLEEGQRSRHAGILAWTDLVVAHGFSRAIAGLPAFAHSTVLREHGLRHEDGAPASRECERDQLRNQPAHPSTTASSAPLRMPGAPHGNARAISSGMTPPTVSATYCLPSCM